MSKRTVVQRVYLNDLRAVDYYAQKVLGNRKIDTADKFHFAMRKAGLADLELYEKVKKKYEVKKKQ